MENPLAPLPFGNSGHVPVFNEVSEEGSDGGCKSCTRGQIGCCCGRRPARLCCNSLPAIPESLSTCAMYTLFLFVGFVLMHLMLTPSVHEGILNAFPSVLNGTTCRKVLNNMCSHVLGVSIIYRICLSLSSFHFILAILTFMVSDSASWRGGIHNGMWGLKIVAVCVIFLLTFLIPTDDVDGDFSQSIYVFIIASFFGSLLFQLLQMVIIIGTIRELCYKWLKKISSKAKEGCLACLIGFGGWGLLVAVGFAFKYMYEYYDKHEWCWGNLRIIIANGIICLLLLLLTTSKCMYHHSGGGKRKLVQEPQSIVVLQTAALSAYVCYNTWSAIAREYKYVAADGFFVNKTGKSDESIEIPQDKIVKQYCGPSLSKPILDSLSLLISDNEVICYISIFFAFAAVMKEVFSASKSAYKIGIKPASRDYLDCCCVSEAPAVDEDGGQRVVRNEREGVSYSYCYFHLLFCFANMYIMMELLDWQILYVRHKELTDVYRVSIPFVVKMISIYSAVFVYFCTIVCTGKCCGILNRTRQVVEMDGKLDNV